ncbi:FadR/GntR family transcriptional regulator [Clostridiaceae bacterium HSG29]|nr:FadR/GntR family transcriptional regulator [Clostridiaceae bacterium HSG29]
MINSEGPIKPIKKKNFFEEVTEQILKLIKEGTFKPGDKLPGEVKLSESFSVSRNSIRESLKALELTGVLNSWPGKGTFVSKSALLNIRNMELIELIKEKSTFKELMDVRLLIEPELAYMAAKNATKEDIEKLYEIVKVGRDAREAKEYVINIGMKFHTLIYEISGNKILANFINSITDYLIAQREVIMMKHLDQYIVEVELHEHIAMLECIEKGESEKVKKMMYDHIKNSTQIVMDGENETK